MKRHKPKRKDTWLRQVARSYRELLLLAVIVAGVTAVIVAAFVLRPYVVAAWNVIFGQFIVSIRHAIGGYGGSCHGETE